MNKLSVANLNMTYFYGANAIKDLSFSVENKECVAVLGESESGKTSLLKCLAGLFPASSGSITLNNKDITNLNIKDRDVLLLLDNCGILERKSVRYNLEYPLKIRKIAKKYRRTKIETIAKEHKLYPLLSDKGRLLYPQDRVRLAVARMFVRDSSLILIDDIFKNVGSDIRRDLFLELLPYLKSNHNAPIIFGTTSKDEAFTIGDKVLILRYGVFEQIGTRNELISNPNSLYVEQLLNPHKNQVTVEVCSDNGGVYIVVNNNKIYDNKFDNYVGQKLIVSFTLKESLSGRLYNVKATTYEGAICTLILENNLKLNTQAEMSAVAVEVEDASLKYFEEQTEKAI